MRGGGHFPGRGPSPGSGSGSAANMGFRRRPQRQQQDSRRLSSREGLTSISRSGSFALATHTVTRATPAHNERYRPGCRRLNTRSVTQVTLRVHLAVARAAGGRSVADFPCRAGEPGLRAEGCRAARRGGEIKPALLARIAAGGSFLRSNLVHREAAAPPHAATHRARIAILLQMRVEFLAHSLGPEFCDVIGDAGDGGPRALAPREKKSPMSFAIFTRCPAPPPPSPCAAARMNHYSWTGPIWQQTYIGTFHERFLSLAELAKGASANRKAGSRG